MPKIKNNIDRNHARRALSFFAGQTAEIKTRAQKIYTILRGPRHPDKKICPNHCAPIEYLWHAFSSDLGGMARSAAWPCSSSLSSDLCPLSICPTDMILKRLPNWHIQKISLI